MPDAESKVVDNTEGQNEKVQSINIPKGVIKICSMARFTLCLLLWVTPCVSYVNF